MLAYYFQEKKSPLTVKPFSIYGTKNVVRLFLPTIKLHMKQEKTITHPQPPSGGLGGTNTSSFGLFLKGGIIVLKQRFDGPLLTLSNSRKLICPSPSTSASMIIESIFLSREAIISCFSSADEMKPLPSLSNLRKTFRTSFSL